MQVKPDGLMIWVDVVQRSKKLRDRERGDPFASDTICVQHSWDPPEYAGRITISIRVRSREVTRSLSPAGPVTSWTSSSSVYLPLTPNGHLHLRPAGLLSERLRNPSAGSSARHSSREDVLQQAIRAQNCRCEVTTGRVDFEPNVIVDRELITDQNPRSDHPIAAKLIEALASSSGRRSAAAKN
jgi:hypothetical protein